ncbi:hypothetical protein B0T20DRAFT_498358 [Sordaria brevicollis]|uniref:Uncharacterized protein n=1 Tax=Sordaria brevicollis TaxID=83679 RepID=A0AAE0PEN9_SORBR|nr:hypothetical protein B0T20DRAFT_498358 [Sordaria brevicollis]
MASLKSICMSLFALTPLVAGHAAIIAAVGDAGGAGMALGIDPSTPRDGSRRNPFQQDTTRFRGQAAKTVGQTIKSGVNKVEEGTQAILDITKDSLPQVTAGGTLEMTLHQINQDGAGPFNCMINSDAKATEWTAITVAKNVPGRFGLSRTTQTDFPLIASIPAGQTCTGTAAGQDNVCLVRCQNPISFGGVVPVQMAGGAGAGTGGGNDDTTPPVANSTTAANKGNKRPLARRYFAKRADLEKDSVEDLEQWQH